MRRRTGSYRPGERYVLQCVGGVERVAEVRRAADTAAPALLPVGADEALPRPTVPGGEWLVEPGERLIRDWAGRYWSVSARANHSARGNGNGSRPRVPWACHVDFTRHTPDGEAIAYTAPSARWPREIGDAELARMLRRAWDLLSTGPAERLRRLADRVPEGIEL